MAVRLNRKKNYRLKLERSRLRVFEDWIKGNHEAFEATETTCIW